ILHGAGNGILTIAMATLPLALFGARGFGARQGWLMLPARIMQALAPFLFGVALDRWAANALLLSAGVSLVAFGALPVLRAPRERRPGWAAVGSASESAAGCLPVTDVDSAEPARLA